MKGAGTDRFRRDKFTLSIEAMPSTPNPKHALFAKRLVETREKRGLSQVDLARLAGIQPPILCHFETGHRAPSFENLRKLAKALNIDIEYLAGGAEKSSAAPMVKAIFRDVDPGSLDQGTLKEIGDYVQFLAERDRKTPKSP